MEDSTPAALLNIHEVAALINCSTRHVSRLADSGQMPSPIKVGALVRWQKSAILEWIVTGCKSQPEL